MNLNLILPFIVTIIMFTFAGIVLQKYHKSRHLYLLFWGLGLVMFGIGTLAESLLSLGWNRWAFFFWYLFGAVLTAAWLGHGTLNLLVSPNKAKIVTVILIIASLAAVISLLLVMPRLQEDLFDPQISISEQYQEIMPAIGDGGFVRLTTPFFNIYGLITLVGGALWSTYVFWRKRIYPNRVIGNVLIAVGALIIASASTLTRFGYGSYLYLGELLAAILMFSGFLIASAPRRESKSKEVEPITSA